MTEETAAVTETPAPTETETMEALYDKLASGGISDEGEVPQEEAAEPQEAEAVSDTAGAEEDAAAEAEPEPVETPSDLPASLKDKWAEIPESAREAVLADRRAMAGKMADLGRVATVARPVYDVILEAAKEIPTMQGMTPQAIAQDVFKMAKIQGQLAADPVRTLLGVAQQYGALDGMRQALAGQAPTAQGADAVAMAREINSLRQQLASVADPQAIEQRIEQTLTARETGRIVEEYAAQKPFWGDVEGVMPQFIAIAQQSGRLTSPKDILDAAYDMAVYANPDLRAKATAPAPAQAQPDQKLAEAQKKALSVNVTSKSAGKSREMTTAERMSDLYDKLVADKK